MGKYIKIMATDEISSVFGMLRKCTDKLRDEFQSCIGNAIIATEKKRHNLKVTFIAHWFKILEFPCNKISNLVYANRALLGNKEKQFGFPEKIVELWEDYKVCVRLAEDSYNLAKVLDMVFREYKHKDSQWAVSPTDATIVCRTSVVLFDGDDYAHLK